ncbi:TraR/DksA C4-type zinc finger protein [Pedococcus sp. KACC 23699]|uniref:TraR/DksA C4-type zinc finger protein n=1 Tax=Pedococcus sp. KACC 23699 TaxID=3149228 RepID=A0AAU7JY09_9MICO
MTSPARDALARELLAADRAATLVRLGDLEADVALIVEASEGSNADDEHDPEGATIAFERAQTSALAASAVAHLREVTAAEGRLLDGTYGVCEVCGDAIPDARLEARPTARTCVTHAARPR